MYYVFDVDGTLSFDGQHIDKQVVDSIKHLESQGHTAVFASARPIRDLLPIVSDFAQDHLLIGGNGAIVQTPENEIEVIQSIDPDNFELIKAVIDSFNLAYIVDDTWNYASVLPAESSIAQQLDPGQLAKNVGMNRVKTPIKIILVDIPERYFASVQDQLMSRAGLSVVVHKADNSLDITAFGVNKYTTLRRFYSGQYYGFGNDSNDHELLNEADTSVWVGTDYEHLKQLNLVPDYSCVPSAQAVATLISQLFQH